MRELARVLRTSIGMVIAHWTRTNCYPPAHPYRQAARMIESYLGRRYG